MQVPRFWATAGGSVRGADGRRYLRDAWGWSMSSAAEALEVAQQRVQALLADPRPTRSPGGYYPRVPLREMILDEVLIEGEQALVITRNRYGAEILNTDRVLIADIDLPELADEAEPVAGGGLLSRLFGHTAPEREREHVGAPQEPPAVLQQLDMVADWAGARPELGVIVYRTASGLRVFVTGVAEPTTSEGERILADLGADPLYRELCRTHGTFRARLTPKPWRLSLMRGPGYAWYRWPFASRWAEREYRRWLDRYEAAADGYAVCRLLASHGPAPSEFEARIIQRHDERTGALSPFPLA